VLLGLRSPLVRRVSVVAVIGALLGAATFGGLPVCPTAGLLGIPCPGCGLTRATLAVLRGDFAGAFGFHPLVFVLAPLYVGALVTAAWLYVRGPRSRSLSTPSAELAARPWQLRVPVTLFASVLVVLVLGVWISRFFGYFGGPVPVETYAAWSHGR
jgi:hypothetical protein